MLNQSLELICHRGQVFTLTSRHLAGLKQIAADFNQDVILKTKEIVLNSDLERSSPYSLTLMASDDNII
ncbi:MAG: hypothetical protein AB8V23_01170 [Candidatus Midichloria sp.]|nr:hypothetical protein MHYMCMPSP_00296 [Hyalomma marginatum]